MTTFVSCLLRGHEKLASAVERCGHVSFTFCWHQVLNPDEKQVYFQLIGSKLVCIRHLQGDRAMISSVIRYQLAVKYAT